MMFKGTSRVGPEEFSRIIQREGGQTNAFTTKDVTAYYAVLAAERIPLVLELERDRMLNLRLRAREFAPERAVVMEERCLRTETQPEAGLLEEVEALAYQAHPYRWPIVGWMEDLRTMELRHVRRYWKENYVPAHMLMVMIGDLHPEKMLDLLARHFEDIRACPSRQAVPNEEPVQGGERRVTVAGEARVPFLAMAFHVPRLGHEDAMALELLASLLAHGRSARLHRRLVREDRFTLDVDANYPLLSLDPGLFTITARILPGRSLAAVERAIDEELGRVAQGDVDEEALARAKTKLEASVVFGLDALLQQAILLARYELCGGWRGLSRYVPGIRGATRDDLRRVAQRYFCPENRTVGWLVPREESGP
jgi:zinc protease